MSRQCGKRTAVWPIPKWTPTVALAPALIISLCSVPTPVKYRDSDRPTLPRSTTTRRMTGISWTLELTGPDLESACFGDRGLWPASGTHLAESLHSASLLRG